MTKDEVNRTIHEAMGLCVHKNIIHVGKGRMACKDCVRTLRVPDYHTPDGFFACWDWAKEQEWFTKFVFDNYGGYCSYQLIARWHIPSSLISPETFATVLAEWLVKERVKP